MDVSEILGDALDIPSDAELGSVASLARQAELLTAEVADLEAILANRKKDLREVVEQKLPAALAEQGLAEIKLDDGTKITVSTYYSASIPKDHHTNALAWLRSHGFEDLIKHEIGVSFGKGEEKKAKLVKDAIEEMGFFPSDKETVHPQTLKAWVREQTEAGRDIPNDLFGVQTGQIAKIARPK